MHLTLRQLSTFREVMRSGSISQAARSLGRTQPAVSTMIRTLESQLSFDLFVRSRGTLTPTPEALYFLEECEDILARVERAERTLERINELNAGTLRIACHPAASSVFLPRLLTEFLQDKADLQVSLIMRSSDLIEELIASQQYDVGFAETPALPRASIRQVDYALECVCVLRSDDPLATAKIITPADLDARPMAILFDQHPTAQQTRAAFHDQGCRFNQRLELRTFLPGLQFVAAGVCVMICDMITAYSHLLLSPNHEELVIRHFRPCITNNVSILAPGYTTPSRVTQGFIAEIEAAVAIMQEEVSVALSG